MKSLTSHRMDYSSGRSAGRESGTGESVAGWGGGVVAGWGGGVGGRDGGGGVVAGWGGGVGGGGWVGAPLIWLWAEPCGWGQGGTDTADATVCNVPCCVVCVCVKPVLNWANVCSRT